MASGNLGLITFLRERLGGAATLKSPNEGKQNLPKVGSNPSHQSGPRPADPQPNPNRLALQAAARNGDLDQLQLLLLEAADKNLYFKINYIAEVIREAATGGHLNVLAYLKPRFDLSISATAWTRAAT